MRQLTATHPAMAKNTSTWTVEDNSWGANLRWFRQYCYTGFHDCFRFHRPEHLQAEPIDYAAFGQVFMAKLLLEVCGAAGAIWGSSEIFTLRNAETNAAWRIVSLVVFGMFLIRFWWHSKHFLEHQREFPPIKLRHRRLHKVPFSQIFSAKLVLEVLGAAGAIWGPAEALTLRTPDNAEEWRIAAIVVLFLFGFRWVLQIFTYCLCFYAYMEKRPLFTQLLGWYEVLVMRFVLIVLGATGAVWGFSEIVTLRTPETNHIWRPISLVVGVIFLFRWILQTREYSLGLWEDDSKGPSSNGSAGSNGSIARDDDDELKDLELSEDSRGRTSSDDCDHSE
jgi:hypothetical protein